MPRVNVYLDDASFTVWESLPKHQRSSFVQEALTHWKGIKYSGPEKTLTVGPSPEVQVPIDPVVIKTDEQAKGFIKDIPSRIICKNGHAAGEDGRCMWKGCKYSRYTK